MRPSQVLCSWDFCPPPQPEYLGLFLLARKCGGSQGCVREHLTSADQECSPEHFKKPGSLHRFTPVGGCVGALLLFHHLLHLFLFQILTKANESWASAGQILWPRPGMKQASSHSRELVCASPGVRACLLVLSSPSLPPPGRPHIRERLYGPHSQLIDITAGVLGWGAPKCFLIGVELLWVSTWLSPRLRRELLISEQTGAIWPELGDAKAAPLLFPLWQALRPCVRFPRRWAWESGDQKRLPPWKIRALPS